MTPQQQSALEGLIDRALTQNELDQLEQYISNPNNRNDVAIATLISTGRIKTQMREIGVGTILATLGDSGGVFLDTLVQVGQVNRNVYWTMDLLKDGRFRIDDPASRSSMMNLGVAVPSLKAGLDALLALGTTPDPINVNAVSTALNIAEGRMSL